MEDSINLPRFLTTVTPLSKFLSAALFITLPFLGFYLGIKYQMSLSAASPLNTRSLTPLSNTPTPQSSSNNDVEISNWKTFTNSAYQYSFKYPSSLLDVQTGCGGMGINNPPPAETCSSVIVQMNNSEARKNQMPIITLDILTNSKKIPLRQFVSQYISESNKAISTETTKTMKDEIINNFTSISVITSGSYSIEGFGSFGLDKAKVFFMPLNEAEVLQTVYPFEFCSLRIDNEGFTNGLYKSVPCHRNQNNALLEKVINTLHKPPVNK